MTDHTLSITSIIISAVAVILTYLNYRNSKQKNLDEKNVKLRVAIGKVNEIVFKLKRLSIVNIDLLDQKHLNHDKTILRELLTDIASYRDQLAEFPEAISHNALLFEQNIQKILVIELNSINQEEYDYDLILSNFISLYFSIYLVLRYIVNILPEYISRDLKNNEIYIHNIYQNFKSISNKRAEDRWLSMKADMGSLQLLFKEYKRK